MSYCTGKNIEKSRGKAMKMLVIEKRPVEMIADRFGVHRSTIWRWYQKWLIQNNHKSLTNDNAHIERFNRTIQEECTGNYYLESESIKTIDDKILSYIDFYNYHRIHLGISYRTPSQMLHRL